jgi:uncharacterized protein YutE (UPF0331/DUF86 family)
MDEAISNRFKTLLEAGSALKQRLASQGNDTRSWVPTQDLSDFQSWMASAANLIKLVALNDNPLNKMVDDILNNENNANGIYLNMFKKLHGTLIAAHNEWENGLLRKIEYIISGANFDEFLDHANLYHKAGKKIEASVLASAVLEDLLKKISIKNSINPEGLSLEPLIEELVKKGVINSVKAKRLKSYSGLRNYALHAEWDNFDIKDVGDMIRGIKELIETI